MLQQNNNSTFVLGIKKYPEDNFWDYKDYRDNRKWQILYDIAKRNGIKVYVRALSPLNRDILLGFYQTSADKQVDAIVINRQVPNYYKPDVLAHELAHFKLHKKLNRKSLQREYLSEEDEIKDLLYSGYLKRRQEEEADMFANRLLRMISKRVRTEAANFKSERTDKGTWMVFGSAFKMHKGLQF